MPLIKLTMDPSLRNSPAIMERVAACPVCSSHTHSASDCTALTGDLKEGFYSPPSGYQGGGDDEDDSLGKGHSYIHNYIIKIPNYIMSIFS